MQKLRNAADDAELYLENTAATSSTLRNAADNLAAAAVAADADLTSLLHALRLKSVDTADLVAARAATTTRANDVLNSLKHAANMANMSNSLEEFRSTIGS